jgi:predicted LPLAT superfamily acyltransferase
VAKAPIHWSKVGESGVLIGMKFLLLVYRVFGRLGFRVCLYPVMSYYYLFRKEARQASEQYLRKIRPLLPKEQQTSLSSFRHFLMFGEILMDKLLVWMGRIRKEDVVFETPDTIKEIEINRRGGIIIATHLGNFEICSALANQLPDMQLTILVYTQHAVKFNTLMKRVAGNTDVEVMQVTDVSPATAMLFSERVNAGGYIVIAGDRTPVTGQERVSTVNFLGGLAPFPQGAFILAGLLKCPVYLMFCLKQQSQYHMYIEKFTDGLKFHDRKQRLRTLNNAVQEFADRLEHYCLKAPLQWFNFFPFWSGDQVEKAGHMLSVEGDNGIPQRDSFAPPRRSITGNDTGVHKWPKPK